MMFDRSRSLATWVTATVLVSLPTSWLSLIPAALAAPNPDVAAVNDGLTTNRRSWSTVVATPLLLTQRTQNSVGKPGRTQPAGSRGSTGCYDGTLAPKGLLPKSNNGLTVNQTPTLFFYIPATTAKTAEFILSDPAGQSVYQLTVQMSGKPGFFTLQLPAQAANNSPLLTTGKPYGWSLALICNSDDREEDVVVRGRLQRVEPSATLAQGKPGVSRDRLRAYGQAGIWHDWLSTLVSLRQSTPTDAALNKTWLTMLESMGLQDAAQLPIHQLSPLSK